MPLPPQLPRIAQGPLGVLLLAHQNADHAEQVVRDWLNWLDTRGADYELLLVDDASTDGTAEKVQAIANPRLRVLRLEEQQGEGAALRAGLAALTQPLLFYTLCQPEYTPAGLQQMLTRTIPIDENGKEDLEIDHIHLITGCRAGLPVPPLVQTLNGLWRAFCWVVFNYAVSPLPGWLGWGRYWLTWWTWLMFGLRYSDPLCPYRLLRREILPRIPLQSNSAFAHIELLAKANFLGCMMGEQVPLPVVPPADRGDYATLYADARKVMNAPDFGPALLPPAEVA